MKKIKNVTLGTTTIMFLFSVPLMIYIFIRAYSLSFVHDECLSFTIIQGIIGFQDTPNNHILNTLLMSFCHSLFGNSEFILRLPNVLAFLLYVLGGYLIFKPTKNNWLFLLGIGLILFNPFLIEFFSLARGYGLSLGFMLIGLFFLTKTSLSYLSYESLLKDFAGATIFASLAVYANLVMINFQITVIGFFILKYGVSRKVKPPNSKHNFIFLFLLFCSFIPLFLAIKRLLLLKHLEQLYFGGSSLTETINSLITASIPYGADLPWLYLTIKILIGGLLGTAILSILIKKAYDSQIFIATGVFFSLTIGLLIEHHLFDAKYPLGRTALFYLPVFSVFSYYLFSHLIDNYRIKKSIYIAITIGILAPVYINFALQVNITYTTTWRYDAHTKEVMQAVREKIKTTNKRVYMTNNWLFEPAINYYRSRWNLNLHPANRYGVDLNSDYIYRLEDSTQLPNFELLQAHPDIQSDLWIASNKN